MRIIIIAANMECPFFYAYFIVKKKNLYNQYNYVIELEFLNRNVYIICIASVIIEHADLSAHSFLHTFVNRKVITNRKLQNVDRNI